MSDELPLFAKRAGRASPPKPKAPTYPGPLDAMQVLAAVVALIRNPLDWTQGTSFRDRRGRPCLPEQAEARSAYGALAWVREKHRVDNRTLIHVWTVLDRCATNDAGFLHSGSFVHWHDKAGRTHADVLAMLERVRGELRI